MDNANMNPRSPKAGSRIKLACKRCQKRKIKCDGQLPTCSSCMKADVACSSGSTLRDQGYSKAYVNSLRSRIRWLEAAIMGLSPEFDLSGAPGVAQEPTDESIAEHPGDPVLASYRDSPSLRSSASHVMDNPPSRGPVATSIAGSSNGQPERVHDIGLVSVGAGQDLRYVGPSSGHAFANLLLKVTGVGTTQQTSSHQRGKVAGFSEALLTARTLRIAPAVLPEDLNQAVQLASEYWETIHPQYPFLHKPTYMKRLDQVYQSSGTNAVFKFQVFMVLAISATVLSHRFKTALSAEGFAASALKLLEQMQVEGSLEGLQCLLLLIVYALINPSSRLNAWYLNYQCIASVLDLGLQRDVTQNLSLLTREMRTRIFWVVYSLDRKLATALGRPIGLRDEACELRLPQDIDDDHLLDASAEERCEGTQPTAITAAIHLINLARLNSEIKYVAHSISHKTPSYCYPGIPDIYAWQADMCTRLDGWASDIHERFPTSYLTRMASLQYHETRILLLRPSPAIQVPTEAALRTCSESAGAVVHITLELYRDNLLVYSWATVHALFLATITMLYCICSVPELAQEAAATVDETLQTRLQAVSNVLSAAAEKWPDARRSRDVLDDVGTSTIRWLRRKGARGAGALETPSSQGQQAHTGDDERIIHRGNLQEPLVSPPPSFSDPASLADPFASLFDMGSLSPVDVNSILQGMFRDCQPVADFDMDFDVEY